MPDVHLLQCLHRIVSEADVKIDYVLLGHPEHREMYEQETKRVVDLFISMQLYDSARAFAKAAHLSADYVTIDQVRIHTGTNALKSFLRIRAIQIYIYLLTYLLTYIQSVASVVVSVAPSGM